MFHIFRRSGLWAATGLIVAGSFCAAAWGQNPAVERPLPEDQTGPASRIGPIYDGQELGNENNGGAGADVLHNPDAFISAATSVNQAAMQSSQAALTSSDSSRVQRFARAQIKAHDEIDDQLEALTQQKQLTPPSQASLLSDHHQKLLTALNKWQPAEFDHSYARLQVQLLKEQTQFYRAYAARGEDPDLREFAARELENSRSLLEKAGSFAASL
ncbi:DUF4142 domain-containing protein [Radicibacter daui]|uniref:DUF4142 domain-containing protein n=1 Tax=Radicibacter daui TaxID=3064829 RepID=UPI004046BE0E